ncbi:MAG: QueT transporter family protein [Clostridia bacterium]|nr:QueT transporter family protein [Clostridia bacterium]
MIKIKNFSVLQIVIAAVIAGLYVALTYVSSLLGLASGAIQVRLSEALTVLPYFTFSAVPGLTVGCLLANWLTGCAVPDIFLGSLATLIGAIFTYLLRKQNVFVSLIPPVVSNAIIVPLVLVFVYQETMAYPLIVLTVTLGEIISCVILGGLLGLALKKNKWFVNNINK